MKYTGGKTRLVKHIAPFINTALEQSNGQYFEPFAGGFNVFPEIKGIRTANDIDQDLIAMVRDLQKGSLDLSYFTKEEYYRVKSDPLSVSQSRLGFISILGSFQGKKWGGYASAKEYPTGYRDFIQENINSLLKLKTRLKDSDVFLSQSYDTLEIPPNSVLYCDPPYAKTTGYKSGAFDHENFWEWIRKISQHSQVFVSEYTHPDDFEVVWSKQRKSSTGLVKAQTKTELLVKFRKP